MKKCNVSEENKGLIVSYNKAINDIKFYSAKYLPKLNCNIPSGISAISYNIDCNFAEDINILELINIFKKGDN